MKTVFQMVAAVVLGSIGFVILLGVMHNLLLWFGL